MNTSRKLAAALVAAAGMLGLGAAVGEDKPGQSRKPGDTPAARVGGDAKAPAAKIVGTYQIVSGKVGKEDIPAERVKDAVVTITRDKIVGVAKDKSQIFVASYTVKPDAGGAGAAADKNQITVVMKGEKPGEAEATGLIQVQENGDLRIVYNLPGGKAPTGFDPEDRQQMFVLKRLKADRGDDRGTDRDQPNRDKNRPKRDKGDRNPSDK